jgi:tRNA (guanosine-2'-O-)-methyltransferase
MDRTRNLPLELFNFSEIIHTDQHQLNFKEVIQCLEPFAGDERKLRLKQIIQQRSLSLIPILDEIHDEGNIMAVLRTIEGHGLLSAYLFENIRVKNFRKVSKGCEKWLDIQSFHRAEKARTIKFLKSQGYQIVCTGLGPSALPLNEFIAEKSLQKTALVIGNEKMGVSQEVLDISDSYVNIPMRGFSQSLNLSVAFGIIINQFKNLQEDSPSQDNLTQNQQEILYAHYLLKAIQGSELLIDHLFQKI